MSGDRKQPVGDRMSDTERICKTCNFPFEYHSSWEIACAQHQITANERNEAIRERDEARRIACETLEWGYIANMNSSSPFGHWRKHVAEVNGWDCYDEQETP